MQLKNKMFLVAAMLLLLAPVAATAQIKLTWEVLKYDINVNLPSDMETVRGVDITSNLELKNQTSSSFDRISLRISDKATVSEVTSGGSKLDFGKGEEKVTDSQKLQLLRVSVPPVAPGSKISVSIKYKLAVEANSGIISLSPVASQFLPLSFWYPTPTSWFYTEGGDSAPFNITVEGLGDRELVSSGSIEGKKISGPLKGMPFFVAGKWVKSENDGVFVYAPDSTSNAVGRAVQMAELANEAKSFAESVLGKKISVPIRIVGVARGSGFSDGGVVFVERGAFKSKTLDVKTAGLISESVVKTVLGNIVEVRGPGFGAIREGLSRFISNKFLSQKYGEKTGEVIRLRQIANYAAIVDKDGPLNVVSPVDGYYYSASGNKGAMIWNYLYQKLGEDFLEIIRSDAADGNLSLQELRSSFNGQKAFLDYSFDQVTLLNLMIGNPISGNGFTRAALRNLGDVEADVKVAATDGSGKEYYVDVNVPPKGFAEARFETPAKIVSVELDPDKLYTQTSYFDDVAPRQIRDDDPLIFIKKEFDKQEFPSAEQNARIVLRRYPEFDEARVFLARSLLAGNKITDAKLEFEKVLDARLPSPQSLAWSLVGLGNVAGKTGQPALALKYYNEAIQTEADYGASLTARRGRAALGIGSELPTDVKAFFASFDKAVIANSKREVVALVSAGEVARFASSVAGQAQEWQTRVVAVDEVDGETISVETEVTLKLLNREIETGLAVFRLTRGKGPLRLSAVEVFEVR